jgi:hypothetical protein
MNFEIINEFTRNLNRKLISEKRKRRISHGLISGLRPHGVSPAQRWKRPASPCHRARCGMTWRGHSSLPPRSGVAAAGGPTGEARGGSWQAVVDG